jgi:hypothetical protein
MGSPNFGLLFGAWFAVTLTILAIPKIYGVPKPRHAE